MPSIASKHILANPRIAHSFSRVDKFVPPEMVHDRQISVSPDRELRKKRKPC